MRLWSLPGLDEWWDDYRAQHADDQETPRIGGHVSVAKRCVATCAQLQAFHEAHVVRQVYVAMARLPVRLSLGTAQRLQEGLRSSYAGFLGRLAEASNVPPLDAGTASRTADAAARSTWRLISIADSVSELDERIRLVESLRAAARSYAIEAVRKIAAQLDADRRLIHAVREEVLELERLATPAKTCTPAIRRWYSTLVTSGSIARWRTLATAAPRLGAALPRETLMIPATLAAKHAHGTSKSGSRLSADGYALLCAELLPRASDASAALARLAERCVRTARNASVSLTVDAAMGSTIFVSLSGEAPPAHNTGVRAVQAPAHLGAFGLEGAGRVYVHRVAQIPEEVKLLRPAEASMAWQLRALADILASGALSLANLSGEYAHWVVKYEYAKHEGAMKRLFDEELTALGAPPAQIAEAAPEAPAEHAA